MKTVLCKISAISLLILLCTVSCKDFLEEDPRGQLSSSQAFTDENDLEGAITALYRQVYNIVSYTHVSSLNQAGDDLTSIISKSGYFQYDQYNPSDANSYMTSGTGSWSACWQAIKAANFIINGVAKTPNVSADEIQFAMGQAYYWRAYCHFHLVRGWGPLPLMLDETVIENQPLNSEQEVYDLIISDLKEAEKLPVGYNTVPWAINGRNVAVSRGAAQASLAYVYLTMAGWPLNKGTEYYTLAAGKAKEVIDAVDNGTYYYRLFDEYWKIHSKQYNQNNQEALLSFHFSRSAGGQISNFGITCLPEETGGWASMRAEIKFWKNFPPGPRKKATYGSVYFHKQDEKVVPWFYHNAANCRNPYFIKHAYTSSNAEYDQSKAYDAQTDGSDDQSGVCIRLADVYCWYAEAVGRSGQVNAKAVEVLNKVRNRADGKETNLYSNSMTPGELAEAAYNEHGWESAGWFKGGLSSRFHDMLRMNRLREHFEYRLLNPEVEVVEQWKAENPEWIDKVEVEIPETVYLQEGIAVTGSWSDSKMYIPYPASDVLLNPNLKR
jgi:hypothetical protein